MARNKTVPPNPATHTSSRDQNIHPSPYPPCTLSTPRCKNSHTKRSTPPRKNQPHQSRSVVHPPWRTRALHHFALIYIWNSVYGDNLDALIYFGLAFWTHDENGRLPARPPAQFETADRTRLFSVRASNKNKIENIHLLLSPQIIQHEKCQTRSNNVERCQNKVKQGQTRMSNKVEQCRTMSNKVKQGQTR